MLTAKQLREQLEGMPDDAPVGVNCDDWTSPVVNVALDDYDEERPIIVIEYDIMSDLDEGRVFPHAE